MPRAPGSLPVVAHFRRVWFKRTETFLHTAICSARRSRPLLIGHERTNAEEFPVDAPVVELCPPGSWAERRNHWRARHLRGALEAPLGGPRARRSVRRHQARVLHAHFGTTGVAVLPLARRSRLPLVTTFYGEDVSRLGRDPIWRGRYTELFAVGARFLVEGPCMREALVELGCPIEKTALQPICIDTSRYPFRARGAPTGGTPRLFFCASFREKKGLHFALEAVARARREHPGLIFRVAGDGPGLRAVEADIDRLELRDCTQLLGFVSHARMLEEMDAADLFLQPSVTARNGDSEGGAPTTLLEAQACGLPVIATTHADLPHVVAPGESALLAPERDASALAAHLLTLLKAPERWAAMGEAGREHVERFHDAERGATGLDDLYLELAEQQS